MPKSATHQQTWLLAYDIHDQKRLQRIHRLAVNVGISLNYSVYYLELLPAQLEQLLMRLRQLIDHRVDKVRLYPCCPLKQMHCMGTFLPAGIHLFEHGTCELAANSTLADNDHYDEDENLITLPYEDNLMWLDLKRNNKGIAAGLWFG